MNGRDEVAWLRRLLAEARAQRDATQRALDKANRDNDALRAELREVRNPPLEVESVGGAYSVRHALRALVDGGAGYFVEDEEE